jgi:nicotinate-nucleotide adenylyltransferase
MFQQARLGILGGTFNPVHWGHLLMAETACLQANLDQVIWVPTYRPPHKTTNLLAFEHRLAMVQQAIADHPNFTASSIEAQRDDRSYAIATLTEFQTLYPAAKWYWIIGLDAFEYLPHWYRALDIASRCHWLVAPRSSDHSFDRGKAVASELADRGVPLQWDLLQMPQVGISSSLVRERVLNRQSFRYLVPESVRHYINIHRLYQAVSAPQPLT